MIYSNDVTRTKIPTRAWKKNQQKKEKRNYTLKVLTYGGKNPAEEREKKLPIKSIDTWLKKSQQKEEIKKYQVKGLYRIYKLPNLLRHYQFTFDT